MKSNNHTSVGHNSRNNETAVVVVRLHHVIRNFNGVMTAELLQNNSSIKILEIVGDDNFDHQKFGMGVIALLTDLKSNQILATLEIRNKVVGDQGAVALGSALQVNHTLTSLALYHNEISEEGVKALAAALVVNTTLATLKLDNNNIRCPGAVALFSALSQNHTLTSLDLSNNPIGDEGAVALGAVMKEKEFLASVKLDCNDICVEGAKALAAGLKCNATLVSIEINRNEMGDEGVEELAAALKYNHTLRELHLFRNGFGARGAAALAEELKMNTTLTSLKLDDNSIGQEGAEALAVGLLENTALESLVLCRTDIGAEGALALAKALESHPTVMTLTLSHNNIGAEGAEAIAVALMENRTLTSLSILHDSVGVAGANAVAMLLQSNHPLMSLGLYDCEVGHEESEALAPALQNNRTLTSLNLGHNNNGDKGAEALATSLQSNASLTSLNISSNSIGDQGAGSIIFSLACEMCVTELDMSHNDITLADNACRDALCEILSLRKLNLSHNKIARQLHNIGQLTNLESVDLSHNELTSIDLALFTLPSLKECDITDNLNLKQPPKSVGTPLDNLRQFAQRQMLLYNSVKVAMVGHTGIGKSTLRSRIVGDDNEADNLMQLDSCEGEYGGETSGIRVETESIPLNNGFARNHLKLKMWDYAGQHIYRGTHQCFFTRQALYVLVFDLTQPQEQSARQLRSWVRSIHSSVSGPVLCLVGTKLDLVDRADAVAKYMFVLEQLLAYKRQWEEAMKNMLAENMRGNSSRHEAASRNELKNRAPAFPDIPSSEADVLCWLVSSVEQEAATVQSFKAALVKYIKRHTTAELPHFRHVHKQRPKQWMEVEDVIKKITSKTGPRSVSLTFDDVCEGLPGLSRGTVTDALSFLHECGTLIWYSRHESLKEKVFCDPKAVTEMLRVLHDVDAARALVQKLPVEQYEDLLKGKLHESAVAVLWRDFGSKYGLNDEDLTEMVVSLLSELYLISPARITEDSSGRLFDCSLLKPRFDFKMSWNECEEVTGGDGLGEWYALDFLFQSSSVEAGGELTVCEERECPEGMCERFATLLQSRQDEWRDFLRYGSHRPLQIFSNCLTDGHTCMVTSTDEAIRVLLRVKDEGARASVLHAAKTIRDLFLKMKSEFYESCVFFNVIVPQAVCVFEFDDAGGVKLPSTTAEPVGGRFLLAHIKLTDDDYVKPHAEGVVWVKALDNVTQCNVSMVWPLKEHDARRRVVESKERRNFVIVAKCLLEHMSVICWSLFRVQFISVMKQLQQVPENSEVLSDERLQDVSRWRWILGEDVFLDSFSFKIPLILEKARDSLSVDSDVAGSSDLLSLIEKFGGASLCKGKVNQWDFRNTIVKARLRSDGGVQTGRWTNAVGVKSVTVSRRPGYSSFNYFVIKFAGLLDGTECEVLELRVESKLPRMRFDPIWENDSYDVIALYKFFLDDAYNFCESHMTIEGGITNSVDGVFKAVSAVKASDRNLNLYECMKVLTILRNKIFDHAQFRTTETDYAEGMTVLEHLSNTLEAYFGVLLLDKGKRYFGGSGAFSGLFQKEHASVKAAARCIRTSLTNNVAPVATIESSLYGSEDDFCSAMLSSFSPHLNEAIHVVTGQSKPNSPDKTAHAATVTKDESIENILALKAVKLEPHNDNDDRRILIDFEAFSKEPVMDCFVRMSDQCVTCWEVLVVFDLGGRRCPLHMAICFPQDYPGTAPSAGFSCSDFGYADVHVGGAQYVSKDQDSSFYGKLIICLDILGNCGDGRDEWHGIAGWGWNPACTFSTLLRRLSVIIHECTAELSTERQEVLYKECMDFLKTFDTSGLTPVLCLSTLAAAGDELRSDEESLPLNAKAVNNSTSSELKGETAVKPDRSIICWCTLDHYTTSVLGVGISAKRGRLHTTLSTDGELISIGAFEDGLRQTPFKLPFEYFLPAFISPMHSTASSCDWEQCLIESVVFIGNAIQRRGEKEIEGVVNKARMQQEPVFAKFVLHIYSDIFKTMVVNFLKPDPKVRASERIFRVLIDWWRGLYWFKQNFPCVGEMLVGRLKSFTKQPECRNNEFEADVGFLLPLRTVVSDSEVSMLEFSHAYIEESSLRAVKWWRKKVVEVTPRQVFDATRISRRLFLFHSLFLKHAITGNLEARSLQETAALADRTECKLGDELEELLVRFKEEVDLEEQRLCEGASGQVLYEKFFEACECPYAHATNDLSGWIKGQAQTAQVTEGYFFNKDGGRAKREQRRKKSRSPPGDK